MVKTTVGEAASVRTPCDALLFR